MYTGLQRRLLYNSSLRGTGRALRECMVAQCVWQSAGLMKRKGISRSPFILHDDTRRVKDFGQNEEV
jgi:hypothetical protein